MNIQFNSKTIDAKFDKNTGRYYATFKAESSNDLSINNSLDCVGDTHITNIQLEMGEVPTSFVLPKVKTSKESGLFLVLNQLRQSTDGRIQQLDGKVENYKSTLYQGHNEILQSVATIRKDYLSKNEIQISENGIRLGSGQVIDGEKIATILSITPNALEVITKNFKIKGNMLVDGTIESRHVKAKSIDAGHIQSGSITSELLSTNSITAKHLKVDEAIIEKLFTKASTVETLTAKNAIANVLKAVKIDVNQLVAAKGYITNLDAVKGFIRDLESIGIKAKSIEADSLSAYSGRIGGFRLGRHEGDGYTNNWLTGTTSFDIGMADGRGRSNQTALWVHWGDTWSRPGTDAWYVQNNGRMFARAGITVGNPEYSNYSNDSEFYSTCNFRSIVRFSEIPEFLNSATFRQEISCNKGLDVSDYDVYGNGTNPRGGRNRVVWWSQQSSFLSYSSDIRLKENITSTKIGALELIKKLNLVSFDWIKDKRHEEIGLVAQELQQIIPDVVVDGEFLSIEYMKLIPYLLKALQELSERMDSYERERN